MTDVAVAPATSAVPSTDGASRPRNHIGAVDGLRAIAVLAVVVYHFSSNALPGGFLGVDLFFVVSGYVITRLLLRERLSTGRVGLGGFWSRRARRLLPAVFAIVVVVQIWSHHRYVDALTTVVNGQSWSSLLYASNWWSIARHVAYGDVSNDLSPLNHLWSLAVEEQFYLVWPVVFVLLRRRRFLVLATILAMIASGTLQIVFGGGTQGLDRVYMGTDTRSIALWAGCLLALTTVRADGTDRAARGGWPRLAATLLALVLLAAVVTTWFVIGYAQNGLFHGQLIAATLAEAGLLAAVVADPLGPLGRVLSSAPFRFVGQRSYALYLWHWPILVMVTPQTSGDSAMMTFVDRVVLIVAGTLISYAFVEAPIRYSRLVVVGLVITPNHTPGPTATIAAGSGTASAGGAPLSSFDPTKDPGRGARVMVAGDSWAQYLGDVMPRVSPGTTTLNVGMGGCGLAEPRLQQVAGKGNTPTMRQCRTWRTLWAGAIAHRPTAIVLETGNYDQGKMLLHGSWQQICDPSFDSYYGKVLDEALDLLETADVPIYMLTVVPVTQRSDVNSSVCMNKLLTAAARTHANTTVLDLWSFLCPRDSCVEAGLYDVTGHLTVANRKLVARWVLATIYAAAHVSTTSARTSTRACDRPVTASARVCASVSEKHKRRTRPASADRAHGKEAES
jgi:peptidoglycan/LPS O-acetylase OafA/YrhL